MIFKIAITNLVTNPIICWPGATEFDQMINLPKDLRKRLNEKYIISTGEVVKDTLSNDGTRKWLINFSGQEVESKPYQGAVVHSNDILQPFLSLKALEALFVLAHKLDVRNLFLAPTKELIIINLGSMSCTFCHTGTQPLVSPEAHIWRIHRTYAFVTPG